MASIQDKIREIEEEIARTQYNKATEHHIGVLTAKLARLRKELEARSAKKGGGKGFAIKKEGDATVILLGFPSVGKSTLLSKLTSKQSRVGSYEFTTLDTIPGMLHYEGFDIQILDIPGIIEGASKGKGRGKEVLSAARSADLFLILLDAKNAIKQFNAIKKELHRAGFRVNQQPADVHIEKTSQGGIAVMGRGSTGITKKTIATILNEFSIHNARVVVNEEITPEQLVDVLAGNRKYLKALYVINKADLLTTGEKEELSDFFGGDVLFISAENGEGLEELKSKILENLSLIRVFTMDDFGHVDRERPLILKKGQTIAEVAKKIHRDLLKNFRYAQVWGPSAKFPGQKVGLDHKVADGDVVFVRGK
ncbi:MAG: GTP-binding protein [Bdellovibrio sp.]|nr:MAG: GTP-binding protein [Bdellovibrio sp.]